MGVFMDIKKCIKNRGPFVNEVIYACPIEDLLSTKQWGYPYIHMYISNTSIDSMMCGSKICVSNSQDM